MTQSEFLFGDGLVRAVQATVGQAWKKHTPEALRTAHAELQGMYRFLLYCHLADTDTVLRLSGEQLRLLMAADALESGELPEENENDEAT